LARPGIRSSKTWIELRYPHGQRHRTDLHKERINQPQQNAIDHSSVEISGVI
jgi:hypothetical protein